MEIHGFKAFHYPMKNCYGREFQENHIYTISGELRFGNNGILIKKNTLLKESNFLYIMFME